MKEISLLFSGGVDSTVAAINLSKKYDLVHLLTFSNGYGHLYLGRAKKRFEELNKRFPGKFIFFKTSVKDIFQKVTINHLKEDYGKYASGFIWCMGCKLSMHARAIIYNKEKNINQLADGSSYDTKEMVEQKPFTVSLIKTLYKEHGLEYLTPVYKIGREKKSRMLKKMGFFMGIPILDRYLGIQPRCIPGELYYLPSILFHKAPYHQNPHIYRFFNSKKKIIEKIIK